MKRKMTSSNDDDDDGEQFSNERMPIESLDDLPTDDSESVGSISSSSDDDDAASGDDTQQHANLTTDKARLPYDEASSSSFSDSSSEDSSDDSSSSSDNGAEEQATNRRPQEQQSDDDSDSDSYNEDDLQNVPLEERIRKRQEEGRSKSARADKRQRASRALQVASERLKQGKQGTSAAKKKSKHRPTEASSKRSDFFKRGAPTLDSSGLGVELTAHRYKPRDPRIMGATSKSTEALDSNYGFLQELRRDEISQLKKKIAVQKLTGKKGQKARRKMNIQRDSLKHDQEELTRLLQEKAAYERAQVDLAAKQAVKQKMKQQVESGKGVYYLKKRDMKKLQMEAKYEELRKRGGDKAVDKALAKRRKKNKSKDTGYFIPKNV